MKIDWIRVEDRLPYEDDHLDVLVYYKNKTMWTPFWDVRIGFFDHDYDYEGGEYGKGTWCLWYNGAEIEVTHWAPMINQPGD